MVGVLDVKLALPEARSLKDKRRVISSLKDRLRHAFNVSVAEVSDQDMWRSARLGVCQVSSDARYVRGSLEKVARAIREFRGALLTDYSIELFHQ